MNTDALQIRQAEYFEAAPVCRLRCFCAKSSVHVQEFLQIQGNSPAENGLKEDNARLENDYQADNYWQPSVCSFKLLESCSLICSFVSDTGKHRGRK